MLIMRSCTRSIFLITLEHEIILRTIYTMQTGSYFNLEQSRMLRMVQDSAYMESLKIDQEKVGFISLLVTFESIKIHGMKRR